MATISEAGPSLEEILSQYGLKETDLDRECPQSVRDEIALKLDDWEMVGRCLEFSLEKLRDINRENTRQELCRIALLDTWGKREGKRATYLKLAGALHRRQRCDLVEFLCAQLKSTLSVVQLALSGSWEVPPANGQQRQVQQYQNGSSSTVFPADVSKRIETLEEQFDCLHDRLVTELSEGGASVDQVLRVLTKLPFTFRKGYEGTILNMLPDLEKREIIRNLFYRLNPLFTFIDYELLQHLVSKFGSQELKQEMTSYAEKVQLFKKVTTISKLIDYWPGLKVPQIDHKMLRTKFEADPKSYTLEKLDYFRNHFYNELRLSQFVSVSILMLLEPANSFIAVWFVPTVVVKDLIEAISQIDRAFLEAEQIVELSLDEKTLYQRSVTAECMTSSVMGPLSEFTHVESPSQVKDALYSLVVSVKLLPPIYEVYIDTHLHYSALKILKLRREYKVYGEHPGQCAIKNFRFDPTGSSEPSLRLIVPEKNPYITAVEPEDGTIRASDIWRESQHEDLQHHLEDYHLKITMKGTEFDPPPIKFEGSTDNSQLEINFNYYSSANLMVVVRDRTGRILPATDNLVLNKDIQFGYHSASRKEGRITRDGLIVEAMNPDSMELRFSNGVAYGAHPLEGRAEFEIMIVSLEAGLPDSLGFGVMRHKKGVPVNYIPSVPENTVNHFIWTDQYLFNNIATITVADEWRDYGYVDLNDLCEGDCVGLSLSKNGVLEFTVNGEIQGTAATNVYNRNTDVYAVVSQWRVATVITKAVTEYGTINLQELCLERLSSWLKSGNEVDRLPLPTRLKDKLKWYFDE